MSTVHANVVHHTMQCTKLDMICVRENGALGVVGVLWMKPLRHKIIKKKLSVGSHKHP